MSRGPFRLPLGPGKAHGRLVDPGQPVSFRFDGRALTGLAGDTVASALLANGQTLAARSRRLHRPRGIQALGIDDPSIRATVVAGGVTRLDRVLADEPIVPGMEVRGSHAWPSLQRDLGALVQPLRGLMPAGFRFKTFKRPARIAMLRDRLLRPAAAETALPAGEDERRFDAVEVDADVLVIGGGLAGTAAAETAAAAGLSVFLVEREARLGGIADLYDGKLDGAPLAEALAARVARLAAMEGVHLLTRATALSLEGGGATLLEEAGAEEPELRGRLWHVTARSIVLATGAAEKPLLFPGSDRPGVLRAVAARAFLRRHGVAPGRNVAILTSSDEGYRTALELKAAGVSIERVVDVRLEPDGALVHLARASGLPVSFGCAPLATAATSGGRGLDGFSFANRLIMEGMLLRREVLCDALLTCGGFAPRTDLAAGLARRRFDAQRGGWVVSDAPAGFFVAGAAAGHRNAGDVLEDGWRAGEQAAAHALGLAALPSQRTPLAGRLDLTQDDPAEALGFLPEEADAAAERETFVDGQGDTTVADLRAAIAEGYRAAEQLLAYTGLDLAQARPAAEAIALGLPALVPHAGLAWEAPAPMLRVPLTALAGPRHWLREGMLRGPLDALVAAAPKLRVDGREVPSAFPRPGEELEAAIRREAATARAAGAFVDASHTARVMVAGPGAAAGLAAVTGAPVEALPVDAALSAVLLSPEGRSSAHLRIGRPVPDRFLILSQDPHAQNLAPRLAARLPQDGVAVADLVESHGHVTVMGPAARDLLGRIGGDDLLDAVGASGAVSAALAGVPCLMAAQTQVGLPAFDLLVPSGYMPALWQVLSAAGQEVGVVPLGHLSLERLMLEAGTLDRFGGRPLFEGAEGRVAAGLLPLDATRQPVVGTALLARAGGKTPRQVLGHVIGAGFSPAAGRIVAMASVEAQALREGAPVFFLDRGEAKPARLVPPGFLKEGEAPA